MNDDHSEPGELPLERLRLVLVEPRFARNVGAIARLMGNFGCRDLVLVRCAADLSEREARKVSTRLEYLLDQARHVNTLDEALSDCVLAVGTSGKTGGLLRKPDPDGERTLDRIADTLRLGRVALVFGCEPDGMTSADVARCQGLIAIPTHPAHPSLNLSHAVGILLAGLFRRRTSAGGSAHATSPSAIATEEALTGSMNAGADPTALGGAPVGKHPAADEIATLEYRDRMYRTLEAALAQVGYLRGEKATSLFFGIRRLIDRGDPTVQEVDLLFGMARQLRWFAERGLPPPDPPDSVT
jgi:tRNA/rRNA methyltransferase